jgi:microcystin-dependent protein
MAEPFLSEIKIISFTYPPKGWAFCNGQTMAINQNQALFSLLGVTFGGNGQTTFALPNLQGRVPFHQSSGFTLGQRGGETAHTVTISEMPQHVHQAVGSSSTASSPSPSNNLWCQNGSSSYSSATADGAMNSACITNVGGSQPHNNMAPYLVLNFIIALQGIFPTRN